MRVLMAWASRLRAHAFTQLAVTGLLSALVGFTLQLSKLSALDSSGRQYNQGTYAGKVGFLAVFGVSKAVANLSVGWLVTHLGYVRTELAGWMLGLLMPLLLILAGGNGASDATAGWRAIMGTNVILGLHQGLCWSVTVLVMILIMPDTRRGLASGLNETLGYAAVASAAPVYGVLESRMVRCGWIVPAAALSRSCRAAMTTATSQPGPIEEVENLTFDDGGHELPSPPQPPTAIPASLAPDVCTSPDTWDPACLGECHCQGYDHLLEAALLVLLPTGLAVAGLLLEEPSPTSMVKRISTDPKYLPEAAEEEDTIKLEPRGAEEEVPQEVHRSRGIREDGSKGSHGCSDGAACNVAEQSPTTRPRSWLARLARRWTLPALNDIGTGMPYKHVKPEQTAETCSLLSRAAVPEDPAQATGACSYHQLRTLDNREQNWQPDTIEHQRHPLGEDPTGIQLVRNDRAIQPESGHHYYIRMHGSTQTQEMPRHVILRDGYAALPNTNVESANTIDGEVTTESNDGFADRYHSASPPLPLSSKAAAPFEVVYDGPHTGYGNPNGDGMDRCAPANHHGSSSDNVGRPSHLKTGRGGYVPSSKWLHNMQRFWRAFLYFSWSNPSTASMCLAGATSNALTSLAWGLLLTWARDGLGVPGPGRNLLTASYSFLKGLVQLLAGAVSDFAGRKAPVVVGLLLNAAGLLTSACGAGWNGRLLSTAVTAPQRLLVQYGYLMLGSCLMGTGAGVFYPVMPAAVVDHHQSQENYDHEDRHEMESQSVGLDARQEHSGHSMASAMATYRFWRDLGYAVGALGGPVADWLGVEMTLMVAAGTCLAVAAVVWFRFEERVPLIRRRL